MIEISTSGKPLHLTPLTEIELYNIKVRDFVIPPKKRAITEMAIKLFKDNAQRANLSIARYNEEARKFNDIHGYLIELKQDSSIKRTSLNPQQTLQRKYDYINYPMIDREAKDITMRNYLRYIDDYNAKVKEHNKSNPATKIQTVKAASQLYFSVILGWYSEQIKKQNIFKFSVGSPTSIKRTNPPKIRIDQRKIANYRVDGVIGLRVAKKTVYNHIKRLKDAGIIIDYQFNGTNAPISFKINPQILHISDANPPKQKTTENQTVKTALSKKLPDNISNTRTNLKREKKKGIANNSLKGNDKFCTQNFSHNNCLADSYKNTTEINLKTADDNKNLNSAAEILKNMGISDAAPVQEQETTPKTRNKYHIRSQKMRESMLSVKELAENMAGRMYENYQAIRYDILEQEVQYGNLTQQEFNALMVQDFWKLAAKIYKLRKQNIVPGLWVKTINEYSETLFAAPNGYPLHKEITLQRMREYRWRIGIAQKLFKKYGLEPMIPTLYFDPYRKAQQDLGFAGTKSMFTTHLKYLENKKADKIKRIADQQHRKLRNKAMRKIESKALAYIKGTLSIEKLYDYVDNNYREYTMQLPEIIDAKRTAYFKEIP